VDFKASGRVCSPLILIVLVSMIPVPGYAMSLEVIPNRSRVSFQGYSTLHDFTGKTDRVYGRVRGLKNLDFRQLEERPRAHFYVDARSMTTDNESRDEEMYKRLRTNRFPRIEYRLTRARVVEHGDTTFEIDARGVLTVAGDTRFLRTRIRGRQHGDTVTLDTSFRLKMSDFGITPPSFMWMVQTKDRVDLKVHLLTLVRESRGKDEFK